MYLALYVAQSQKAEVLPTAETVQTEQAHTGHPPDGMSTPLYGDLTLRK